MRPERATGRVRRMRYLGFLLDGLPYESVKGKGRLRTILAGADTSKNV
jgi:hypothetical protein